MRTKIHKVREYRSPYGYCWPLIPRRIGMALKLFGSRYPQMFYRFPKRVFNPLFSR